ncbi:hypothetical protein D3C74_265550 [compost metagenome]
MDSEVLNSFGGKIPEEVSCPKEACAPSLSCTEAAISFSTAYWRGPAEAYSQE